MPYEMKMAPRGVHQRFFDVVSFDDIMAGNHEIWSRPDWAELEYQIADMLDVEEIAADETHAKAIGRIADIATQRKKFLKVALVATRPNVVRLCEIYAATLTDSNIEVRLFDTLSAATDWAMS